MAAQPPLQPLSPPAQQFVNQVSQLAQQLGIRLLVVAVQDPQQPAVQRIVASQGGLEALRALFAARLGLVDEAAVRAQIENELGSTTGWDG